MEAEQAKVLVVDDDPAIRDVLDSVLVEAGYRTETAADGTTALERLSAGGIDLVLLDLMLPGMDGREVCRQVRLRSRGLYLPIIMVTALAAAEQRHDGFLAGADIHEFAKVNTPEEARELGASGQRLFNKLAELRIPTMAVIHGPCMGGGVELSLACDYRVVSDDPATRVGLPETTLGLIPAWGGCTRLPRLIGIEKAADAILKGKLYSAQEALKLGLVDEVAPRAVARREPLAVERRRMRLAADGDPVQTRIAHAREHRVELEPRVERDLGEHAGASVGLCAEVKLPHDLVAGRVAVARARHQRQQRAQRRT